MVTLACIFPNCLGEQVANAISFTRPRSNCAFLGHLVRSWHLLSSLLNEMSQMFRASEISCKQCQLGVQPSHSLTRVAF